MRSTYYLLEATGVTRRVDNPHQREEVNGQA